MEVKVLNFEAARLVIDIKGWNCKNISCLFSVFAIYQLKRHPQLNHGAIRGKGQEFSSFVAIRTEKSRKQKICERRICFSTL